MTFTPKWRLDLVLAVIIGVWFGVGRLLFRHLDIDVFLVKGSAILTFLFLSAAISLGPLARLCRPATHFIYNRRHLGVTTWGLAVYVAYGFVAIHFLARFLGDPPVARRPLAAFIAVAAVVAVLHVVAAIKEARGDRPAPTAGDGLILLGTFTELPEGRATTVHA